jgi:hypothetical protein
MKIKLLKNTPSIVIGAAALILCVGLLGCKLFGSNPAPPSAFERTLFDVITNHVTQTNILQVPVPVYTTQFVTVTATNVTQVPGQPPVVVIITNVTPERVVDHYITNTLQVPVTNETYTLATKESTKTGVQGIGSLVSTLYPGIGGLVSMGILAALGGWAQLRGNKQANTSVALSQEIETVRNFIKMLPNGTQYDNALTQFMQTHQLEAGVVQNVLSILNNKIKNEDARTAANEISDALGALMPPTPALAASKA